MTINRNNFEAYMLDYLEGNLDPLFTADLMVFLAENPDFEKFITDYDSSISLSDAREFGHKALLRKDFSDVTAISPENFDEFCIAASEGLLNEREQARLADYISLHTERQHNLALFRKLRLQSDTSIVFTGKRKLKKLHILPISVRSLYYAIGIAASISLLIMLAVKKPAGRIFTESRPVSSQHAENTIQPFQSATTGSVSSAKPFTSSPARVHPQKGFINKAIIDPVTTEPEHKIVKLNPLTPITEIRFTSSAETIYISNHLSQTGHNNERSLSTTLAALKSQDSFASGFLGSLFAKVDFWKTAENAIQGFNYLTEAQMSIDKTTDEDGKLTGLQLGMESYKITGNKIK